jgi:hypothetical protein
MSKELVVGLRPWLPWPLSRSRWWTASVPAERLAALRIGLAAVLLLDLMTTYVPHLHDFFGGGSLGAPEVFPWVGQASNWSWSLFRGVQDARILTGALAVWCAAAVCLLVGFWSRTSAIMCWVLSLSFANLNPYLINAGDQVRGIILFYLMVSPCGAAWSWDRWRKARFALDPERILVPPWPLRLLFVQMAWIYFCNGAYKIAGADWRSGASLYYVLGDLTLARWSYAQVPIPYWMTQGLTWAVMVWEISFPLVVALPELWSMLTRRSDNSRVDRVLRAARVVALWFGVAFHVGIGIMLELGWFAPYMLCLYLPLVPWERFRARKPLAAYSVQKQ